jgi:hypothetical protein
MESESTQETKINPKSADLDFQTGKILALSIGHFIHDVYSSFLAPLLPLLIEKLSMSLTQADSGGGQRVVYDDLIYRPFSRGCRGRVHRRPDRIEYDLSDQRRHRPDRHSVCFDAAQEVNSQLILNQLGVIGYLLLVI